MRTPCFFLLVLIVLCGQLSATSAGQAVVHNSVRGLQGNNGNGNGNGFGNIGKDKDKDKEDDDDDDDDDDDEEANVAAPDASQSAGVDGGAIAGGILASGVAIGMLAGGYMYSKRRQQEGSLENVQDLQAPGAEAGERSSARPWPFNEPGSFFGRVSRAVRGKKEQPEF